MERKEEVRRAISIVVRDREIARRSEVDAELGDRTTPAIAPPYLENDLRTNVGNKMKEKLKQYKIWGNCGEANSLGARTDRRVVVICEAAPCILPASFIQPIAVYKHGT